MCTYYGLKTAHAACHDFHLDCTLVLAQFKVIQNCRWVNFAHFSMWPHIRQCAELKMDRIPTNTGKCHKWTQDHIRVIQLWQNQEKPELQDIQLVFITYQITSTLLRALWTTICVPDKYFITYSLAVTQPINQIHKYTLIEDSNSYRALSIPPSIQFSSLKTQDQQSYYN